MSEMDAKEWRVGDEVECIDSDCYSGILERGVSYDIIGIGHINYDDGPSFRLRCPEPDTCFRNSRFKFVRRPTSESEKKPIICVHCDENKVATEPPSDPLWCAECCRELQEGYASSAPVIEEKSYCALCSANAYGVSDWRETEGKEPIRHDDPCQFTHLERLMLPKAKAMFRERQFAIRAAQTRARLDAEDLENLTERERRLATIDNRGTWKSSHYTRLTGHVFKD